jgi:N-acetylmuramoyl-L-alanine amidase
MSKDNLYTARWYAQKIEATSSEDKIKEMAKELNALLGKELYGDLEEPKEGERETPAPDEATKGTLVVVVGHERKAPGAAFALGGNEYHYNSEVASKMKSYADQKYPNMKVEVVFRDGVGISGAYKKAKALNPDACIELHYNAFNKQAFGTETLTSVEDKDQKFAKIIQAKCCEVFERHGQSRGLKVLSRGGRGGQSLYGMPGSANCLVEPFFGDNPDEAKLAQDKQEAYAHGLVDAFNEWAKSVGLS